MCSANGETPDLVVNTNLNGRPQFITMYKLNIHVTGCEHFEFSIQSVIKVSLTKKDKECTKIKPSLDPLTKKLQWKDGIQM